jgi:hypothetical protein
MCVYPCAASYTDERIAGARRRTQTRPRAASGRAHVCVCDRARTHPRRHMKARSRRRGPRVARRAGVLLGVGVQREHRLVEHRVCHHVGKCVRRSRPRRRALWRMRSAGVRCGAAGCARRHRRWARVRTRVGTRLLGAMGVGTAARRGGSVHASEYIHITYVCACVLPACKYIHYPFICTCENRPGLCVLAPVCDGDGSAVCARVGGLVLRARPNTRNPKPCEPLPVGVDRVVASARRRSNRRRRSTRTSARGTPRASPRCPMYAPLPAQAARTTAAALGRASMRRGRLSAAAPPMGARAHTCRQSLARGLGCRYGRAEGRFGTCIGI